MQKGPQIRPQHRCCTTSPSRTSVNKIKRLLRVGSAFDELRASSFITPRPPKQKLSSFCPGKLSMRIYARWALRQTCAISALDILLALKALYNKSLLGVKASNNRAPAPYDLIIEVLGWLRQCLEGMLAFQLRSPFSGNSALLAILLKSAYGSHPFHQDSHPERRRDQHPEQNYRNFGP